MTHENRMSTARWMPDDESGHGYDMMIFDGGDDRERHIHGSILRKSSTQPSSKGVLYVPAVTAESSFQADMAAEFNRHGYNFYAVDLGKEKHAIHPGEAKTEERELRCYFDYIRAGLDAMTRDGIEQIVIFGHCTGALALTLFVESYTAPDADITIPAPISALILNSPFLSYNKIFENDGGAWRKAVDMAGKALEKGALKVPVLVLQSDKASPLASNKAANLTVYTVYDGEVDVRFTEPDVKAVGYTEIFTWLMKICWG